MFWNNNSNKTEIIIYRNGIGMLHYWAVNEPNGESKEYILNELSDCTIVKTMFIYENDNSADDICPVARYDAKRDQGIEQEYNELYEKVLIPAYNEFSFDYNDEWETQMQNVDEMIRTGNFY